MMAYLHIFTMKIRNGQIRVELYPLSLRSLLDACKQSISAIEAVQDVVVNENLKAKDLLLFGHTITARVRFV
jgi:hypothetical protein